MKRARPSRAVRAIRSRWFAEFAEDGFAIRRSEPASAFESQVHCETAPPKWLLFPASDRSPLPAAPTSPVIVFVARKRSAKSDQKYRRWEVGSPSICCRYSSGNREVSPRGRSVDALTTSRRRRRRRRASLRRSEQPRYVRSSVRRSRPAVQAGRSAWPRARGGWGVGVRRKESLTRTAAQK